MIVNTHGELVAEDNEKKTAPAATSSNSNRTAMVGNQFKKNIEAKAEQAAARKIKLSSSEYERLAGLILRFTKNAEKESSDPDSFGGITQAQLLEKMGSVNLHELNTLEELYLFNDKLRLIINRLIKTEKLLYVVEETPEIDQRKVRVTANWQDD